MDNSQKDETFIMEPSNKRATLKDIAAVAGVSTATVSNSLNNNPVKKRHNDQTIQRIQRIAKTLNYRPNRLAKGLVTRTEDTPTVVVMTPDVLGFGGAHNNEVFAHIVEAASERGININVRNSRFNKNWLPEVKSIGSVDFVDGIILHTWLATESNNELVESLVNLGRPFVLANHYVDDPRVPCVGGDMFQTGIQIAKYMLALGHKRFGIICGPRGFSKTEDFLKGIRTALVESELRLDEDKLISGNYQVISDAALRKLISLPDSPTAYITASDTLALNLIGKLDELGFKVPDDISVIGFGNEPYSQLMHPKLTTADEHSQLIAYRTVEILTALIDGRPIETKARIKFEIIESTLKRSHARG